MTAAKLSRHLPLYKTLYYISPACAVDFLTAIIVKKTALSGLSLPGKTDAGTCSGRPWMEKKKKHIQLRSRSEEERGISFSKSGYIQPKNGWRVWSRQAVPPEWRTPGQVKHAAEYSRRKRGATLHFEKQICGRGDLLKHHRLHYYHNNTII